MPRHALSSVALCAALLVVASADYRAQSVGSPAIASRAEVVVFGATPAGITSAVSAARAGRKVVLVEPGSWVGGMMSGGLSNTDTGPRGPEVISGLAGEFFRRVRAVEEARGACLDPCASTFLFEPQAAEQVFEAMLNDAGVAVERAAYLLGVEKNGATIVRLRTSRGEVNGDVFIDASYEGDLMKLAGVPFQTGREPRRPSAHSETGVLADQEDNAGVQQRQLPLGLHLDPYRVPGDPASGLIAFVEPRPDPLPEVGAGDSRVTAYTYRLCVTDDPANRIPFARPSATQRRTTSSTRASRRRRGRIRTSPGRCSTLRGSRARATGATSSTT
jgi:FAD dependent oxidoreductase